MTTVRSHLEAIRDRFDHKRVGPPEWHENCVSCATYADAVEALRLLEAEQPAPRLVFSGRFAADGTCISSEVFPSTGEASRGTVAE